MENLKVVGTRRFYELQAGDMFSAIIHDIRPSEVTIRFVNGEFYTARSKVLPESRIGEESLFLVKENDFEGRIILEMVKMDQEAKKDKMITSALKNANLTPTNEIMILARKMIESGLPVDAPTLNKAALLLNERANYEYVIKTLKENTNISPVPEPKRFTFDMRV